MSRRPEERKLNIGHSIDGIWNRLPENHYLFKSEPLKSELPHESLLIFGKAVLDFCAKEGVDIASKLKGHNHSTWVRLVGAWTLFQRQTPMTRNEASQRMNIDPSNLTNFINGKRTITSNALHSFSSLLGIQVFDLTPELGAAYARGVQKTVSNKLQVVDSKIDELRQEMEMAAKVDISVSASYLLQKINDIKQVIAS